VASRSACVCGKGMVWVGGDEGRESARGGERASESEASRPLTLICEAEMFPGTLRALDFFFFLLEGFEDGRGCAKAIGYLSEGTKNTLS
jgi:hypothetical protein